MASIAKMFKGGILVILIAVGLIGVLGFSSMAEYVENQEYVVHQGAVSGDLTIWNEPGWNGQWFGRVEHIRKTGEVYLSSDPLDGGTGAEVQAIDVQFPDGKAKIDVVATYKLSLNQEIQKQLAIEYPTEAAIKSLIRQQIIEAVKQTGPLMSSSEAYAEKRSEFGRLAREQALNGTYRPYVRVDTTYDTDSNVVETKSYSVMLDDKGSPVISKESVLSSYGISFLQFTVKDMDFDDKTIALIEARKDAQKAKQDKITAQQKGDALIAEERARQEVQKIKEVTIAEKEKAVAILEAEKSAEKQRIEAEALVVVAENEKREAELKALALDKMSAAEALANKRKVAAGLTPQERAEWEYKTKVGVAEKISDGIKGANYPTVFNNGGGSEGGSGNVLDFLGYEAALNVVEKMSEQK